MASSWTEHGPIALPPRPLALGMGAALVLLAFVGTGLGLRAAWKDTGAPDLGGVADDSAGSADTLTAKPIVELPATPPASNTADNSVASDESDNSEAIQERTAEAQQVQSNAAKSNADIDKILTSPSEKPTAPAKSAGDEAPPPPGPPVKSDVPF